MSLYAAKEKEINFGEGDSITINTSLSYESTMAMSQMTDGTNNIEILKKFIISMQSDGMKLEPTDENLKKLPFPHIIRLMTEMKKCMGVDEDLKKN